MEDLYIEYNGKTYVKIMDTPENPTDCKDCIFAKRDLRLNTITCANTRPDLIDPEERKHKDYRITNLYNETPCVWDCCPAHYFFYFKLASTSLKFSIF